MNNTKIQKENELKIWLKTMAHLAPQGSAEWLDRKHIGGSEIAVLNGTGAFKSWFDWLKERCEIKASFCPIINGRWGHTFEDVQIKIIQSIWECKIYETGSVPGNPGIAYSPDGIAVVSNEKVANCLLGENVMPNETHSTILFEFKSPPKNMPKGEVPSYYMAQPLTGLCTLKLCDYSVFINSMFRRCQISDFNWSLTYDKTFHNKDKEGDVKEILALGIIAFYKDFDHDFVRERDQCCEQPNNANLHQNQYQNQCCDQSNNTNLPHDHNHDHNQDQNQCCDQPNNTNLPQDHDQEPLYIDCGNCDLKDLEYMFYKESVNDFKKAYSKVVFSNDFKKRVGMDCEKYEAQVSVQKFINEFNKKNKGKIMGILPYKLFKIDFIKVDREEDFVNNLQPMIDKSLEIIKTVKTLPLCDRMEKLLEYFPEKRKTPKLEYVEYNDDELKLIASMQNYN